MGDAFGTQVNQAVPGKNLNASRSNAAWSQLSGTGALGVAPAWLQAQQAIGRTPSQLYGAYAESLPAMSQSASDIASAATSPFGTSARTLAAQQSDAARRQIEQRLSTSGLGNFGSGAALRSIAQGVAAPLTEAETAIAQQYGNAYMNAYSPVAQMAYQNLANQGSQYAGLANALLGAYSGQAAPEWTSPVYTQEEGWASQLLGGLTGGLGNVASGFAGSTAGSNAIAKLLGL